MSVECEQCPAFLVKVSTFVGQIVGYGIGIARLFVGQILKIEFKLIPYFQSRKKWTGWDLNPRPQLTAKPNLSFI
ncbi:MAG TPA: hypothetical protein VKA87_09695 [Nitrososphaeraceae archaeon]|nr:hypothetical protein [Nitrososphaeraceae archaeon]